MNQRLVVGFIGTDKPGLVRSIADLVQRHDGNWLESRMNQLANHFSGIALVDVKAEKVAELTSALEGLEDLHVWVDTGGETGLAPKQIKNLRCLGLNIVGPDRPGIVHDISLALEQHVANVVEMETHIASAPMSGESTFSADVVIEVAYEMDWRVIADRLDEVANALGMDILLEDDSLP